MICRNIPFSHICELWSVQICICYEKQLSHHLMKLLMIYLHSEDETRKMFCAKEGYKIKELVL